MNSITRSQCLLVKVLHFASIRNALTVSGICEMYDYKSTFVAVAHLSATLDPIGKGDKKEEPKEPETQLQSTKQAVGTKRAKWHLGVML